MKFNSSTHGLLLLLIITCLSCIIITNAQLPPYQQSQAPDLPLIPVDNELYPYLDHKVAASTTKSIYGLNETIIVQFRFNIEYHQTPEDMIASSGSLTLLSLGVDWQLSPLVEGCVVSAPESDVAVQLVVASTSFSTGTIAISVVDWPRQTAKNKKQKIVCNLLLTTTDPAHDVSLYNFASSNALPFPIYDAIESITVSASRIFITRALQQSQVPDILNGITGYTGTIPQGNDYFDEDDVAPFLEVIPLDGLPYLVDIEVDTPVTGAAYVYLPTRSYLYGEPTTNHIEPTPAFKLIDGSLNCGPEHANDIEVASYDPAFPVVFGFIMNTPGFYKCTALMVALDVPPPGLGQFEVDYVKYAFKADKSGPPPRSALEDVTIWSRFPTDDDDFNLEFPYEILPPFVAIIVPPIIGIYPPQVSTLPIPFLTSYDKNLYGDDYREYSATGGVGGTEILHWGHPQSQIDEYDILRNVRWSIAQSTTIPNEVILRLTVSGGTGANPLPPHLFKNAMMFAEPFNLIGPVVSGAITAFQGNFIIAHNLGSFIRSPTVLLENHFPISNPVSYPFIAGWGVTDIQLADGTTTVEYRFQYPIFKQDPPDTTGCVDVPSSLQCIYSATTLSPNLSKWTKNQDDSYETEFPLYINGKYIQPSPTASSCSNGKCKLVMKPLTSPTQYQPALRMFFGNSAGDVQYNENSEIETGKTLYYHVEIDPGFVLSHVHLNNVDLVPYYRDLNPITSSYTSDLALLPTQPRICPIGPFQISISVNGAGEFATIWGLNQEFTRQEIEAMVGYPTPFQKTIFYTYTQSYSCSVPFLPSGVTSRAMKYLPKNLAIASDGIWMPKILPRSIPINVGIQPTRPFFLNQINFGSLRISNMPTSLSSVSFFYRRLGFRVYEVPIQCRNDNPLLLPYKGSFAASTDGTARLQVIFDQESVERIREDAQENPNMSCSSIPLMVTKFDTNDRLGSQILSGSNSIQISQTQTIFPQTYSLKISTALVPGRISSIKFTVTSSIPGRWLLTSPYTVDQLIDPNCRDSDGISLMTVVFYDTMYYTADQCRDWLDVDEADVQACVETARRFVFDIESSFQYSDVETPKTCTFSANRRFSSRPDARSVGTVSFPMAPPSQDDPSAPLYKYVVSVLFPSISYLPPATEFQLLPERIPDPNNVAKFLDVIQMEFFNIKMDTGAQYFIDHTDIIDQNPPTGTFYPQCTLSADDLPAPKDYDGSDKANSFVEMRVEIGETPKFKYVITFNQPIEPFQQLVCTFSLSFRDQDPRKPQTAIGSGTIQIINDVTNEVTAIDNEQRTNPPFLNLPPITSQYEFGFNDAFVGGAPSFKLRYKNILKNTQDNSIFINFDAIGLEPVSETDPTTTFTCKIGTNNIPTRYSRLTNYVAQLDLKGIELNVGTEVDIECTINYAKPDGLTKVNNIYITASLFEFASGQYGVATASTIFNPPQKATDTSEYMFVQFLSPALANTAAAISRANYPGQVEAIIAAYRALFTSDDSCTTAALGSTATLALCDQREAYNTVLDKVVISSTVVTLRQAYFRRITSLTDPIVRAGSSSLAALAIQDLANVVIRTQSLTTDEVTKLRTLFISNPETAPWWTSMKSFADLPLKPFGDSFLWSNSWPTECFQTDKRMCGINCPHLCTQDITCNSDFDCATGYCKAKGDSKTELTCQPKDFSLYPADFFSAYTTKTN